MGTQPSRSKIQDLADDWYEGKIKGPELLTALGYGHRIGRVTHYQLSLLYAWMRAANAHSVHGSAAVEAEAKFEWSMNHPSA